MIAVRFESVDTQQSHLLGTMRYDSAQHALIVVDRLHGQRTTQLHNLRQVFATIARILSTEFPLDTDTVVVELPRMALSMYRQSTIQIGLLTTMKSSTDSSAVCSRTRSDHGGGNYFNVQLRT